MKNDRVITSASQIVNVINELKETAHFYLERYRFDPFMVQEHSGQIQRLDEMLKQIKEND